MSQKKISKCALLGIVTLFTLLANSQIVRATLVPPPFITDLRQELSGLLEKIETKKKKKKHAELTLTTLEKEASSLQKSLKKQDDLVENFRDFLKTSNKNVQKETMRRLRMKRSIAKRNRKIGQTIGALQRMRYSTPPAILVPPKGVNNMIHAASLLSAILPQMHAQIGTLAKAVNSADAALLKARNDQATFSANYAQTVRKRNFLSARFQNSQSKISQAKKVDLRLRQAIRNFAYRALSIEHLIGGLTQSAEKLYKATARKKQVSAKELAAFAGEPVKLSFMTPFSSLLSPRVSFETLKGKLPPPVSGTVVRKFGVENPFAGTETGVTFIARAGEIVSSPCDGRVVFSGPIDSRSHAVIIDAGNGYSVVLSKLNVSFVKIGQFILSKEPIGIMEENRDKHMRKDFTHKRPMLYVELRKDNLPIDPAPWLLRRTKGDTPS